MTARCFDSEEEALIAINEDRVKEGEVAVLRYQGPRGYMRRYRKHVRPASEGAILD